MKGFVMNFTLRKKALFASLAAAGASLSAIAADPATAQEALATVSTSNTGYGPVLWAMAAGSVAILIGVKWIKRGRGAS